MSDKMLVILEELRVSFLRVYVSRLENLILFGSHARGDAEDGSDIDILVVLNGEVQQMIEIKRTGTIVSEISLKYDITISCVFIDEKSFAYKKGPFLRNIRKEGIEFDRRTKRAYQKV